MKKTIITIIAFLSASTLVSAKIKLGVQAGASVSQANLTAIPNTNDIVFVQPGLVSELKLLSMLNFRPSLNYQRTGFSTSTTPVSGSFTESNIAMNNINIPLDLSLPIKLGAGRLMINAGPSINYAFSGNNRTTPTIAGIAGTPVNTAISFGSAAGEFSPINWGTNFGLGYQMNNGLELKGNYTLGLSDLDNTSGTNFSNNVINLMLGYFFIK
jgi:hypothetical protein